MKDKNYAWIMVVSLAVLLPYRAGIAAEPAAAGVITRIEPADTGVAYIRSAAGEKAAVFMAPVYPGDRVIVESLGTTVQVRLFAQGMATATDRAALEVPGAAPERSLGSNLLSSLVDKVARSGERSQRNLVTRADGDLDTLELSGWRGADEPQRLAAGERSLFLHWNHYLAQASYVLADPAGRAIASGAVNGDFVITAPIDLVEGLPYKLTLRAASGREIARSFMVVGTLPAVPDIGTELGDTGRALQLLALAGDADGRYAFEAIQGVLDLSADELDRRALIDELALMACCGESGDE